MNDRAGRPCLLPAVLIYATALLSALSPSPAPGASSWQVRSFPSGSGRFVAAVSPNSFFILGGFGGSREWVSTDGGISGSIRADGPPFSADSVLAFDAAREAQIGLTASGILWEGLGDGRNWVALGTPPKNFGVPSTAIYPGGEWIYLGTRSGTIVRRSYRRNRPVAWIMAARVDTVGVRQVALRGNDQLAALLADGRLLVQDSSWIAAPFRASIMGWADDLEGYAVEQGTLSFWKTTDGGLTWNSVGTSLARPDLAPWARRAGKLVMAPDGFGVLPCGDALLATRDGGESFRLAASGTGMFLDAAIDQLGNLMTVGSRVHRSVDLAFSLQQVLGGEFTEIAMGSVDTFWNLDHGLLLGLQSGELWLRQPLPDSPDRLRRIAARGDHGIWLHFDGGEGSRSFRSTDRGATYELLDPDGLLHNARSWLFPTPGIAWAFNDSTVMRSDDDGWHWRIVRDGLDRASAMAARDSAGAIVFSRSGFSITGDAGVHWQDQTGAPGAVYRSLAFSGPDHLIGLDRGLAYMQTRNLREPISTYTFSDSLRAVRVGEAGIGWAAGGSGLLIGTTDGGFSWSPYRINLELNSISGDFRHVSTIDGEHAVTGTGLSLVRLRPDNAGPLFRYGISANPYLVRYLDIHITARERLQGDSLHVTVGDEEISSELFDPSGFLYLVRYRVPQEGGPKRMLTRARDWIGNERTDVREIVGVLLSGAGQGIASWAGTLVLISGSPMGTAAMLEEPEEPAPLPPEWAAVGRAFQFVSDRPASIRAMAGGESIARLDQEAWRIMDPDAESPTGGAWFRIVRDAASPAPAGSGATILSAFPIPARDYFNILWTGPTGRTIRWSLVDATGRRIRAGEGPASASPVIRLDALDGSGRPLASGGYWLTVESGDHRAVKGIVVVR